MCNFLGKKKGRFTLQNESISSQQFEGIPNCNINSPRGLKEGAIFIVTVPAVKIIRFARLGLDLGINPSRSKSNREPIRVLVKQI